MKKLDIGNIIAVIFIVLIALILGGLTYLKYYVNNNNSTKDTAIKQNDSVKDNNNPVEDTTTKQDDTVTGITLQQIVDNFNSSATVKLMNESGSNINATVNGNSILVSAKDAKDPYTYTLANDILSSTASKTDLSAGIITMLIIDSVQQLHGVVAEESFKTLNSDEINNYTLAKDNIEMKTTGNEIIIKLNINKKMTLIDFTDAYINTTDLNDYAEYVKGDGSANFSKGNLMFLKNGYDNEAVIIIYEENKLTNNAYKSLISTITFIYDEKEANRFSSQYSSLAKGDKTFGKYKVEINPELDDFYKPKSGTYEWVRLTIDKGIV